MTFSATASCATSRRRLIALATRVLIQWIIITRLLRELVQQRAALAHDRFGHFHLRGEGRVECSELDAVRRLQRIQLVALLQAQPGQQLLRIRGQSTFFGIDMMGDDKLKAIAAELDGEALEVALSKLVWSVGS